MNGLNQNLGTGHGAPISIVSDFHTSWRGLRAMQCNTYIGTLEQSGEGADRKEGEMGKEEGGRGG